MSTDSCKWPLALDIWKQRVFPNRLEQAPSNRTGARLAKSLPTPINNSAESTQRYALNWLKERAQHTSPMRKFKDALIAAMRELERLEIIANGRIERSAN